MNALVLTGHGINCEAEMAHALRLAGAHPQVAHLNDWLDGRVGLAEHRILAFPGGFSFGDHLGSGRVLANRIRCSPRFEELRGFVAAGGHVTGVCNGFQALVKLGLLPDLAGAAVQEVTLAANASGRFEDRWVRLIADPTSPCAAVRGLGAFELPVRHGEGRLVAPPEVLARLSAEGFVPLRYADAAGHPTEAYPANPNGSPLGIAGLCDASGRVFGLMPHPEAAVDFTHHPRWTREAARLRREGQPVPREGQGLPLFRNLVAAAIDQKVVVSS